MMATKLVF